MTGPQRPEGNWSGSACNGNAHASFPLCHRSCLSEFSRVLTTAHPLSKNFGHRLGVSGKFCSVQTRFSSLNRDRRARFIYALCFTSILLMTRKVPESMTRLLWHTTSYNCFVDLVPLFPGMLCLYFLHSICTASLCR